MELYHVSKGNTWNYVNWNNVRSNTDFGQALYFSTTKESAEDFSASLELVGYNNLHILTITMPDNLLFCSSILGLSVLNFGYRGINENEIEEYMSYDEQLRWTRYVLAHRTEQYNWINEDADIIIGNRADTNRIAQVVNRITSKEVFDDDQEIMNIFEALEPWRLKRQVALRPYAVDVLFNNHFYDDQWEKY